MTDPKKNTAVVILSAGISERMSAPKALLRFDERSCFLEKIVNVYSSWGCGKIVVVVNPVLKEQLKEIMAGLAQVSWVGNPHPELERFYSVKLGLQSLAASEYCFIQDVDNPFIDSLILDRIWSEKSNGGYISPVFAGKGGHPVLLNKHAMELIRNWKENNANLREVLSAILCRKVEMDDHRVLININTPEIFHQYFKN